MEQAENFPPGVYAEEAGELRCLHRFELGEYGLEDVAELLHLGELRTHDQPGWTCLVLQGSELRELKVQADAYSFDLEQGLVEMCLAIVRACPAPPAHVKLWANF